MHLKVLISLYFSRFNDATKLSCREFKGLFLSFTFLASAATSSWTSPRSTSSSSSRTTRPRFVSKTRNPTGYFRLRARVRCVFRTTIANVENSRSVADFRSTRFDSRDSFLPQALLFVATYKIFFLCACSGNFLTNFRLAGA